MSLNRQIAVGAAWLICGRILVRVIGLTSTIILARLLVPEDFGLIALAMSVVAILDVMSAFSFDLALIADQKADHTDYNTAWTMSVIKGLVGAICLLIAADPMAGYFDDQRLVVILQVLALFIVLRGFENIGVVNFRKNLEFDKEFRFNVYLKLVGFSATLIAAYILRDYRALLIGITAQAMARVVISFIMSSFRPHWDLTRWRPIMSFSKWLLVNNLLIFLNQRSTTFILGKVVGMRATGLFSVAEDVGNLVTTELVWPVQRAVFPGYAKISDNKDRLKESYLDVLTVVMTLGLPLAIGIACSAEQFVKIFLGPTWIDIIPLISLMTIAGAVSLCSANSGSVFMAVKRAGFIAAIAAILAVIRLPALIYAVVHWQAIGAAYALILSSLFILFINWLAVAHVLKFSISLTFAHIWRAPLAAGVMWLALYWLETQFNQSMDLFENSIQLIILISAGAVVYTSTLFTLWLICRKPAGAEQQIIAVLQNSFNMLQSNMARQ